MTDLDRGSDADRTALRAPGPYLRGCSVSADARRRTGVRPRPRPDHRGRRRPSPGRSAGCKASARTAQANLTRLARAPGPA